MNVTFDETWPKLGGLEMERNRHRGMSNRYLPPTGKSLGMWMP
jgi:hypothetical protein